MFFIFKSNQVFLKESKRGLTSGLAHWLVASLPLYALRIVLVVLFGEVSYHMLNMKTTGDKEWFFILNLILANLAGFVMCEAVMISLPSIRDVYLTLPALIFLQFYFSAIPIKPVTLPAWLSPWIVR